MGNEEDSNLYSIWNRTRIPNQTNQQRNQENQKKLNDQQNENNKIENLEKDIITKDIKPRGLKNIGSTCYMNSVLQCLFHIFDLSNELLKLYDTKKITEKKLEKMPMTYAFLEVIAKLSFDKENSIKPNIFKKIIGNNESFRYYEANDSKTLVLYVLDTLNQELNENKIKSDNVNIINPIRSYKEKEAENIVKEFNDNYNSLIADLFNGLKMTSYICNTCNNSVKNYQIFNIITCSIEKTFIDKHGKEKIKDKNLKVDIYDCLKVDEKPNIFEGDNQIYCDTCKKSSDGKSLNKICIAPKILILFLDRGLNNKFMKEVDFPEELDINEYLLEKGKKYHLIGTIEHLGPSGESGHFIANCKHFDGNWYIFSDSKIAKKKKEYKKYGIPYLLFYRRDD